MSDAVQAEHEPVAVLLVDDEENILRSIQRLMMDEEDVEIVTATSGEEGLKLIPGLANLGLIVSDQRMPGMTGALFLEKAREINPDATRIILTGYADVTAAVDAINRGGAWRYLAKPWNDEELVRVIHEGLERYRIIIENRSLNALVLKQNQELDEWNSSLKQRVFSQTAEIRKKNEELHEVNRQVKGAIDRMMSVDHTRHALAAAIARVELESGHALDPGLIKIFRSTAAETYPLVNNRQNLVEQELQPPELRVGMLLARDIISGTGLLLLGHGEELDQARIASISRYYRIDPPDHGVFVLVER